ncbi:hypothetical protein K443DRAFT_162401 [Laccaria amethystina LaAM-08-1]|uniref:Uncharacterized protein n=1 Tax=Laccaria amethystina LaAM-08-1 TaxID=1095629 RepID=A0A0C9XDM3_9AGAR|nr:hypothetical protein K443DRAFT_162401 [Laccaria amethystina LaAM-08-1]
MELEELSFGLVLLPQILRKQQRPSRQCYQVIHTQPYGRASSNGWDYLSSSCGTRLCSDAMFLSEISDKLYRTPASAC